MKNKTPIILGGVFLLLVIIFIVTSINPREKSKGATPLFKDEKPSIDKLEFTSKTNGQIVLEKQNSIWYITAPLRYKASEISVDQTIMTLQNMVVDGSISSRVEAQDQYEVSEEKGTVFKAYSGDKLILDAVVGKYSTDLAHTYARLSGSNDILLWRGVFSQHVTRTVNDWRDKSIYTFNTDDVISVKAVSGKNTRELALADTVWVFKENGKEQTVDTEKVKETITLISTLRCDDFADEKDIPRAAGKTPDTKVSFTIRNGDTHSFDVWTPEDDDAGRYLVRIENGEEIFRFYRYRGELLEINYDKLKPDA